MSVCLYVPSQVPKSVSLTRLAHLRILLHRDVRASWMPLYNTNENENAETTMHSAKEGSKQREKGKKERTSKSSKKRDPGRKYRTQGSRASHVTTRFRGPSVGYPVHARRVPGGCFSCLLLWHCVMARWFHCCWDFLSLLVRHN